MYFCILSLHSELTRFAKIAPLKLAAERCNVHVQYIPRDRPAFKKWFVSPFLTISLSRCYPFTAHTYTALSPIPPYRTRNNPQSKSPNHNSLLRSDSPRPYTPTLPSHSAVERAPIPATCVPRPCPHPACHLERGEGDGCLCFGDA